MELRVEAAHQRAAQLGRELEDARRDLQETLARVNHKVEKVEESFSPHAIVGNYPMAFAGLSAVLGYFAGSSDQSPSFGWMAFGAIIGLAFASSGNHRNGEPREPQLK